MVLQQVFSNSLEPCYSLRAADSLVIVPSTNKLQNYRTLLREVKDHQSDSISSAVVPLVEIITLGTRVKVRKSQSSRSQWAKLSFLSLPLQENILFITLNFKGTITGTSSRLQS